MSTELAPMPAQKTGLLDIVHHIRDIWDLGDMLVKSRMIPSTVNTPEAAAAIIMKGHELGIGPMQAFDSISVIQGKPTISPQLMLALIERSGLLEDMSVDEGKDHCTITLKRRGRSPQTVTFDRSEAVAMKLAGKDNWLKQFGVMMYWRCVAKGCRRVFPDVIAGCYTPDEMGAEVGEDGEIIDGEVIERPQIEERPASPTARGSGLFSNEHKKKTVEFMEWIKKQCDKINSKWAEEWEEKLASAMNEGLSVPEKVGDVISTFQARGHLLKWAIDSERIDPKLIPEDLKPAQSEAFLALVFHDPEHKKALIAEMGEYLKRQRQFKSDALYRKFPDLAPEGWAEEQKEAAEAEPFEPGDAYEGPDPDSDAAVLAERGGQPAEIATPPDGGSAPRSGRALFAWVKDQEQRHEVGLLKYINSWGKLQDYPGRMVDWDDEQVLLAHAEAARKLKSINSGASEPYEEAALAH